MGVGGGGGKVSVLEGVGHALTLCSPLPPTSGACSTFDVLKLHIQSKDSHRNKAEPAPGVSGIIVAVI